MESAEQGKLRLVLEGERVAPETIGIGDLSKVLKAFTDVVTAAGGDPSEVSMVDIQPGSVAYDFTTAPETSDIMADVISAMGADGSRSLGADLDAAIRKTRQALPSHVELVIEQSYGQRVERTRLEAGGKKEAPKVFRGHTTLHGLVTGVIAGKSPTARIRPVGESRVVVMECSIENARVFGGLILRTVKVEGLASWNVETLELEKFEVVNVREFNPAPMDESLRGLAKLMGDAWSGRDVAAEIAKLRGDDENG